MGQVLKKKRKEKITHERVQGVNTREEMAGE